MLWQARPGLISGRGAIDAAAGGGGGGGGFPSTLTGLIGWWDASVTASLTLSGSDITAVADQSGAGNDMTGGVGVGAFKPTYNATGFNTSYPAMMMGVNFASLTKSSFAFGTGNTLTFFCVGQLDSANCDNFGRILSYYDGAGSNDADHNAVFLVGRNNAADGIILYRNFSSTSKAVATNAKFRCIATVDSSGVMTIYIDGVAAVGSTLNAAFGASGTLTIGMAAFNTISPWRGSISEIGIATGFTNSTDVGLLDSYLQTKWGL